MASLEVEDLTFNIKRALIEEMTKGQEITARLKFLLAEPSRGGQDAGSLVDELFNTFSKSLTLLDTGEMLECSQDPAMALGGSPLSEVSSGKVNISLGKDRRGGAKTRRQPPLTWVRVASEKLEDGHMWRKYGQKEIQSNKFPRSYYRCSHRQSQGCQATKQVQRTEDDPSTFMITYRGDHTCKDLSKVPQLITESTPNEPHLISFGSTTTNTRKEMPQSSSLLPQVQEFDEILSDLTVGSSSSDYFMMQALTGFEGSPSMTQTVGATNDHRDGTSGLHSCTGSFDMSFMEGSFGCDDVLMFDQDDLF